MTGRRIRLRVREVENEHDLQAIAGMVAVDDDGSAEFGGFYGDPERLAALLGPDRRVWLLDVDGEAVGFLDADHVDGVVAVAYFVAASHRRRGIASGAVGRLLGLNPWPDAREYSATIGARNLASREVVRAAGFRLVGADDAGDLVWSRTPPRRRGEGPARFLDADGRIDRYPLRDADRLDLLAWVADRGLPHGQVWTEGEVNELLEPFAPSGDVAVLRRYLVDADLLERTRSGSQYARVAVSAD